MRLDTRRLPTREEAAFSAPDEYFRGNSAKSYCCALIDSLAAENPALSILDLGCGDGTQLLPMLRRHPGIRYVGVEPSGRSAAAARRLLEPLGAQIVHCKAEDYRGAESADCIVSFSVLEHVVNRIGYMQAVSGNLASTGLALINYDSGHFLVPPDVDPRVVAVRAVRSWVGRTVRNFLVTGLGAQKEYQRFVRAGEFDVLARQSGLEVVEARNFNTSLKTVAKHVPFSRRLEFERRWADLEMWLDDAGVEYHDSLAGVFTSRNIVLRKRAGSAI